MFPKKRRRNSLPVILTNLTLVNSPSPLQTSLSNPPVVTGWPSLLQTQKLMPWTRNGQIDSTGWKPYWLPEAWRNHGNQLFKLSRSCWRIPHQLALWKWPNLSSNLLIWTDLRVWTDHQLQICLAPTSLLCINRLRANRLLKQPENKVGYGHRLW